MSMEVDQTRHRRLRWIITGSLALTLRDLWLATRGGGITPRWLLCGETISFALCAASGIAELNDETATSTARRTTVLFGYAGLATHSIRLVIFLARHRDHPPA